MAAINCYKKTIYYIETIVDEFYKDHNSVVLEVFYLSEKWENTFLCGTSLALSGQGSLHKLPQVVELIEKLL